MIYMYLALFSGLVPFPANIARCVSLIPSLLAIQKIISHKKKKKNFFLLFEGVSILKGIVSKETVVSESPYGYPWRQRFFRSLHSLFCTNTRYRFCRCFMPQAVLVSRILYDGQLTLSTPLIKPNYYQFYFV